MKNFLNLLFVRFDIILIFAPAFREHSFLNVRITENHFPKFWIWCKYGEVAQSVRAQDS